MALMAVCMFYSYAALLNDWHGIRYNSKRRHPYHDSAQYWLKLTPQFQRERFLKYYYLLDDRRMTNTK